MKKITFALYFGNRGFFPGELIAGAIEDMKKAVTDCGCDYILMDVSKTKYGAVETIQEGKLYADFLKENAGKYQGVILCLPNFGDENGAEVALADIKVPVLVQAYPDVVGEMDFARRRDAMCGKFAMCNVLRQNKIKFTLTTKFTDFPSSDSFKADLVKFAQICRVADGLNHYNVGAIGARTTAFKTVRTDEIALCNHGINVEDFDLSNLFMRMDAVDDNRAEAKKADLLKITDFGKWPVEKLDRIARCGVAIDDIIAEYNLKGIAIRCWDEFQKKEGFAPCLILCDLNEKGISAACEVDINNAIMMSVLTLASGNAPALLDFNNNYNSTDDKAIMFHCGPVPISMLEGKGVTEEHLMFKKSYGAGTGVGINKGKIKSGKITFGSLKAENGKVYAFVSDGEFTDDKFDEAFFGTGKVIKKEGLNDIANYMSENGYKHHLCIVHGDCKEAVAEALSKYRNIEVKVF